MRLSVIPSPSRYTARARYRKYFTLIITFLTMTRYSEKEPLLGADKSRIAADNEISTITCPSFAALLTKPFQCLPQLAKHVSSSEDEDIEYSDDDETLPDLPESTTTLPISDISQADKLYELRKQMKKHGIGVYLIPSEDEHQSEYTALPDKRRDYISGFTGSAGIAVVTLDDPVTLSGEAILSTDGRYFLQAEKELDPKLWKLFKQGTRGSVPWNRFSMENAVNNKFSNVISCDPRTISVSVGEAFESARILSYQSKFEFKPLLEVNLVDEVWGKDKPTRSLEPIYHLPLKYSGVHTNEKLSTIRTTLQSEKYNATHLLITSLDDITWLFNLRADSDIPFNPVFFAYSILTLDAVTLYVNKVKIDNGDDELRLYLSTIDGLVIKDYQEFHKDVAKLKVTVSDPLIRLVLPSKSVTTYALLDSVPQSVGKQDIIYDSIIANTKIIKNSTELFNAKIAQYKDSLAFILFVSWLEHNLITKRRVLSEYDAACKIYSIRSKLPNFKGLSYGTISSSGPNAAVIHYEPTKEENSIIDPDQIYLVDSGGHYLEGTTDITRTYIFGRKNLTDRYKKFNTLVLKGHLSVAMAKFPPNNKSTGTILDAYSRQPLWNEGLDFNHGTGHGVGSFGNVHEAPLYILSTTGGAMSLDLFKKGAILTDEPGYYVDGEVGFRIESELEIVECDDSIGKTRGGEKFLSFSYLTKVPFCRALIDTKYLSPVELNWINEYHSSIREDFGSKLLELGDKRAYAWLIRETASL